MATHKDKVPLSLSLSLSLSIDLCCFFFFSLFRANLFLFMFSIQAITCLFSSKLLKFFYHFLFLNFISGEDLHYLVTSLLFTIRCYQRHSVLFSISIFFFFQNLFWVLICTTVLFGDFHLLFKYMTIKYY